jgi:hypothetical protein
MSRKVAVFAIVAALAVAVLWIGTTHRDRCMRAGNVGCTIVPWSGHPAPAKQTRPPISSLWGGSRSFWGDR